MQNFKLQDAIKTLSKQIDRKQMQILVYQWVITKHITCKEYLDLFDWICNNSSIVNERYEGDNE